MRLAWAFRVSGYLTLALACACLLLATSQLIPGIQLLALPLLLVLAALCCLEGRIALPVWAANLLGFAIALGGAAWIGWQLFGRINDSGLADVPVPAALLPFLGPVLITLMLVKLLRPKHSTDHWVMQGLGLILVALSCVLGTEPESGILLLAYFTCGIWHLAIFHFYRESVLVSQGKQPTGAAPGLSLTRSSIRAVGWTGIALVIGLPFFLLLPRQGQSAWSPYEVFGGSRSTTSRSAQTGFANEIDLNSTGLVEVNDEIALTVQAEDDQGRPKLDLSADQRWRGAVLDYYDHGRWIGSAPLSRRLAVGPRAGGNADPQAALPSPSPPQAIGLAAEGWKLPNLGPGQFYLTFTIQSRDAGGLFLAEPVVLHRTREPQSLREVVPVVSLRDDVSHVPRFVELRQTLQPVINLGRGEYRYRQVTLPSADFNRNDPVDPLVPMLCDLLSPVPNELRNWTDQLLQKPTIRATSGIIENDFDLKGDVAPGSEEKIAVALTEYLAHSGEYTYTLERRRDDSSLDPTLDFLQNVKQGHCERFAGALALMLRSHGIHARVVTGFRGAENKGEGAYAIRQNFAHSWVEALVLREGHWHWRMLDPTPSTTAPPPSPFSWARWWSKNAKRGETAWKDLILNYESEQQEALWQDARDWVAKDGSSENLAGLGMRWRSLALLILSAVAAVPVFWLAYRFWVRRRRRAALRLGDVPFYNRLLALLVRHARLQPQPAQTPREFAETARRLLQTSATTAPLAEIPSRIAALLYRVRYGQRPLSAEEKNLVERELEKLAVGLTR